MKPYDGDMESYRALLLEERGAEEGPERRDDRDGGDAGLVPISGAPQPSAARKSPRSRKPCSLPRKHVEKLTKEIAALDTLLADPALYAADPQ